MRWVGKKSSADGGRAREREKLFRPERRERKADKGSCVEDEGGGGFKPFWEMVLVRVE